MAGGTYLGWGVPTVAGDTYLGWGIPTLATGVLPWPRGYLHWPGVLPWPGGTYLRGYLYWLVGYLPSLGGVPTLGRGYLPWSGVPTLGGVSTLPGGYLSWPGGCRKSTISTHGEQIDSNMHMSKSIVIVFIRFKIKVNGRMTDPCLKQVNQHYVTQLEPNKIQVPYTNGISRTFEDTLIATLIVIRDISPTLSIWEAFELRTLASPITYCITIINRCSGLEK